MQITIDEAITHKKPTQANRILKLLQERGQVTNVELNRVAYRYSARVAELRKRGYVITSQRLRKGVWLFVYNGEVN